VNVLLILPLLLPMTAAILSLLAWNSRRTQRVLCVIGTALLFVSGLMLLESVWQNGIQAAQMDAWPAPFGITVVADLFSAIMVAIAGFMGLAVAVYSLATMDRQREAFGYYPLLHILLMGVCGAFLTGDLFNLYVWFEVMLMASFVLMALGGERAQMEGAIKYVTLNLISSAMFLAAVGMLYGVMGTLNMADLAQKLRDTPQMDLLTTIAMLFLVAFGIKAAVFPLFFWLPASYHTPPVAVSVIFAGLLTKVGVYALIRVFTLLFVQDVAYTHMIILVIAGLTMLTGVLGAVAQADFRRLLAFHIISQIGYLLMGLGLLTTAALAGAVYFMVHVIIAKASLFLVSGVVYRLRGTYDLKKLGGLYGRHPFLAILFLIPALSLAGVPPLSGFFGKLALIQAGLWVEQYAIVATALVVSILTLFSMIKIWNEAFWKEAPETPGAEGSATQPSSEVMGSRYLLILPIAALALAILFIGLAAEPLYLLASGAAEQLMNPAEYIHAVLGRRL
jgi:multicomponent Na+:H+ antiporter subunit D